MLKHSPWGFFLLAITAFACAADKNDFKPHQYDWPQWQGPERNSISRETGLLKSWPEKGLPLLWKVKNLGGGYCTPSVAAGRIFGVSFSDKDEVVWALNEKTGKGLWKTRIADAEHAAGGEARDGSRGSITVDDEFLYAVGQNGDVVCLRCDTGKEIWHKNLVKDFGGSVPAWGYSESPLIDGDKVICTPGNKNTLVALNKKSGETIWQANVPENDGAGYSSVIVGEVGGQRQYIQMLSGGVVGVAAEDGKFLWRYDKPANGTANCSTPIFDEQSVFAASGYGKGGGLVKIAANDGKATAKEIYFTKKMQNQHGGMVLVDGYLYGANDSPNSLVCLEFKTGKVMWEERKAGKGSIAYADGRLYYRDQGGPIILVEANPKEYVERGRFKQPDRSDKAAWAHPAIANGRLLIADQDVLLCYDVKEHK